MWALGCVTYTGCALRSHLVLGRPDLDPVPGGKGQNARRATSRGHKLCGGHLELWGLNEKLSQAWLPRERV